MTPERKDELKELARRVRRIPVKPEFACMECGRKFRTVAAAERAAFGNTGCPRCGSTDVDLVSG